MQLLAHVNDINNVTPLKDGPADPMFALQMALLTSVVVTIAIVVGLMLLSKKIKKAPAQKKQHYSPLAKFLLIAGLTLLGLGALYALSSHTLHEALPFLEALPHSLHTIIGIGGSVAGLILLIAFGFVAKKNHNLQQ
jgi:peptidoglycan biosynthesis protein MviN/MurJ (putative lipid II flippase)